MKVTGTESPGCQAWFFHSDAQASYGCEEFRVKKETENLLPKSSMCKKKWPVDEGNED